MSVENFVESLRQKHAALEERLHAETTRPYYDTATVQRLKFEKLRLKEKIDHHLKH